MDFVMLNESKQERLEALAELIGQLTEEQEEVLFLRMGAFIDGVIYATGKLGVLQSASLSQPE